MVDGAKGIFQVNKCIIYFFFFVRRASLSTAIMAWSCCGVFCIGLEPS